MYPRIPQGSLTGVSVTETSIKLDYHAQRYDLCYPGAVLIMSDVNVAFPSPHHESRWATLQTLSVCVSCLDYLH